MIIDQYYLSDPIIRPIIAKLTTELDPSLKYHSIDHTLDVVKQSLQLAEGDQLNAKDKLLLAIAAAYHDAGFLFQKETNEPIGANMAANAMDGDDRFDEEQKVAVRQAILDTAVSESGALQTATGRLSPWLLDADVANFGRNDFMEKTSLLAMELRIQKIEVMSSAARLMDRHTWVSNSGFNIFSATKIKNRELLEKELDTFRLDPTIY